MMIGNWTWMTGYGFGHWFFFVVMVAVIPYPIGRILNRLGLSHFKSQIVARTRRMKLE